MTTKESLRTEMRTRRKALSPTERATFSQAICARLTNLTADDSSVAVYLAGAEEIDLTPFIDVALARGVCLSAPRWTGLSYELAVLKGLSADCLRTGPHGILEPRSPDAPALPPTLWLVPGLAFARDGSRLGYGGGWYDRLLAQAAPARAFGVAASFQIVPAIPMEPHDRRLSGVVTETGLIEP